MVHSEAPMTTTFFNYILSGNLPLLDSLSVKFGSPPDDILFNQVLRYLKRPFKVLDVQVSRISDDSFDLLRKGHFNTLQSIDLSGSSPIWYYHGIRSDWTIQVLTSCPSLEVIKSKLLTSEDIISSGPWVCHGLKRFSVYIEMVPITNIPEERLVEEELQHCQIIYQRLSELEELQVLEMFDSTTFSGAMRYRPRGRMSYSIPLPLRLNAGLGQLSKLTELTTITFWSGHHAVPKKEYRWMLDHWKKLEKIFGGWRIEEGTASKIQDKYLWAGKLREWLEYQGITVSAYYQEYKVGKGPDEFNFGWCSEGEGKITTLESKLAQLST
ncbi:hypothetical protein BGZ76_006350 [Entomortierella beljakovae]|nr:hypothetical protein BGZ76_006350 [Entomortierella beljakovae]